MDKNHSSCCFVDYLGRKCDQEASENGLCFWHDPDIDKTNMDLSQPLEQLVRGHHVTCGLQLERANLTAVNLVNHSDSQGFDLSESNFYRANLKGAHLFNANLNHANLMKADLTESNLHFTTLKQANLLGVKWSQARIEHMEIGSSLLQETEALRYIKSGQTERALDYYEQAEEIYRDLRKVSEQQGLFSMSGEFIQKELRMRRFQMPFFSVRRFLSKLIDLFCGYGEAPLRVVFFSIGLIFITSFFYLFLGLSFQGEYFSYQTINSKQDQFIFWLDCVYYSVVTFTTLGYGDYTPIGFSRLVAALEAFIGSFTLALFVVVFVKKMTR